MINIEKKLTKIASGYVPPEKGPFECEHCFYFEKPCHCKLVEGNIDEHGCCNLFVKRT